MNEVLKRFYASIDQYPDRVALDDGRVVLSYTNLADQIERVQARLRESANARHMKIGLYLSNGADYVAAYYAVMASGSVPFLIDRVCNKIELNSIHHSCGVSDFIVHTHEIESFPLDDTQVVASLKNGLSLISCNSVPRSDPSLLSDTVTCRFTSGSTGEPKCLEFKASSIVMAAVNWKDGTQLMSNDRILCIASMSNGLAFNTSLLSTFIVGAELHFYNGIMMAARILDVIGNRHITRLVGFPAIYQQIVSLGKPAHKQTSCLSLSISASAPLSTDIKSKYLHQTGTRIADYYGIAETGPVTFENVVTQLEGLGTTLPGADVRIADAMEDGIGQIQVRTASFASRYLNRPGEFEQKLTVDGYFKSDDIGSVTNGRLYLVGKSSNSANIGGRKVYTQEITQFIQRILGVIDAEVFTDRDGSGREILHALVVVHRHPTRETIIETCRKSMAGHKVPSRITFVDEIPRSGAGKAILNRVVQLAKKPSSK